MPKRYGKGHAIAIATLFLAMTSSHADTTKIIRFGLTADYPPFGQKMPDGTLVGADIVTARKIASVLGAQPEFVITSWQTLGIDFSANRFDIAIGGLTVTPERAALGVFSVPLMDDGKRPLARCAERNRYQTLDAIDQPSVRVMINAGPSITELAKQWFKHAQLTPHIDDGTQPEELLRNKVDVWVTDGVAVDHMARRYQGELCATTLVPYTHLTKAWLIHNDPPLVAAVNRALSAMVANGDWKAALEAVR